MSGVPKKSRLRRRAAAEEDTASVAEASVEPTQEVPAQEQPLMGTEGNIENRDGRDSIRSSPRGDVRPNNGGGISPRASPRVDGSVVQNGNPSPRGGPTESDSLVPQEDPDAVPAISGGPVTEENKQKKKGGFHFRRGRKALSENTEQIDGNAPEAPVAGESGMENNRTVRPMPRYGQYSIFDCLVKHNLMCGMGYNLDKFHRHGRFEDMHPGLVLNAEADGLAVGITVQKLHSYGEQLVGVVKPLVKIHLVSIDTGYYVKSRSFPATAPATTAPCPLVDTTTLPSWGQEIILNAYYSDTVAEDTLLLFEVLDDKPSLRSNYHSSSSAGAACAARIAKRIAWGYLLPIGMSGEMNVGFSNDWRMSVRDRQHKSKSKNKGGSQEGSHVDDGSSSSDHHQGNHEEGEGDSGKSKRSRNTHTEEEDEREEEGDDKFATAGLNGSTSGGGGSNSSKGHYTQKYPLDKPSVDKAVRVQMYQYRDYDGIFGMFQRKVKGWPTIGRYTDK
jgi:hypothetical protein